MIKLITDNITLIKAGHPCSNIYLYRHQNKNILIDTGAEKSWPLVEKDLQELGLTPDDINIVINTHMHWDHVGNNFRFPKAKIYIPQAAYDKCRGRATHGFSSIFFWLWTKKFLPAGGLKDGGDIAGLQVINVGGHTKYDICLYEPNNKILFTGDVAYARGTVALHRIPDGSRQRLIQSLQKLKQLDTRIMLPGHGSISEQVGDDLAKAIQNLEK